MYILLFLAILLFLVLIIAYWCYRLGFYAPRKEKHPEGYIDLPEGEVYEPYYEDMTRWILEARALPQEKMQITTFDGLKLTATYYEFAPGAPIELMFHGYRGNAERDLSGGVQRCFRLGHSALIVDQRCAGGSEGHTITFGIKEHKDAGVWLDFMLRRFGPEVKIILTGLSMGAATVMMAAGTDLPPQVVGVLADCGYSSAKEIIGLAIQNMGLPVKLSYPFARLGARIFGSFDPEETSPVEALKKAKVPVIFFHGEADDFVPCYMSKACFDACASRKRLVTVPGAGHGLSYPKDPEGYIRAVREFFGPELCPETK
jgi:fermentation-respiration switch protein FrsA (DUF1100 family)